MHWNIMTVKGKLAERSGLTLMEVMVALGIFLVGSVSILALFVAASVLHADAVKRRTASFIADELLAEVRTRRGRDVFARALVVNDLVTSIEADAVMADIDYQAANFDLWPLPESQIIARGQGPLLIEGEPANPPAVPNPVNSEWAWYSSLNPPPANQFVIAVGDRWKWVPPGPGGSHSLDRRILQPRTWYYVVDDQDPGAGGAESLSAVETASVIVNGNPAVYPGTPTNYIVIDREWIGFDSVDASHFYLLDRGLGDTQVTEHRAGTPVTVAREHPRYPGFYYTVQFYPVNARGAESHVVISVAYGTEQRFRAHFFHTVYTPAKF